MKKALIITNTASMVHLFNDVNIDLFQKAGYQVHVACNFVYGNTASEDVVEEYKKHWKKKGVIAHQVGFLRSPFSFKSFSIYKRVKVLLEHEDFDIIHCHTPIVSVLTRLAARKVRKRKATVVYTAHGFHFFKGAPFINWLIYYPVEKLMSYFTDYLITITKEDYNRAVKKFKAKNIRYIQGVGVDINAIESTHCEYHRVRRDLGISDDAVLMISVGEINNNKNHKEAIKALSLCENKDIHYIVAGIGSCRDELIKLSKELCVEDRVQFLGFRTDVYRLLKACDLMVHPSHREGLSVAIMEAMVCSLPVIATDTRGNDDLIDNGEGGFLIKVDDVNEFAAAINKLSSDKALRAKMGEYNAQKVKQFDKKLVVEKLMGIFKEIEGESEKSKKEKIKA